MKKSAQIFLESLCLCLSLLVTGGAARNLKGDLLEEFPHPLKCPPNEVWDECRSSSCFDRICYDVLGGPPRDCTTDCVSGCTCIDGYVRFGEECLPEENCWTCTNNWVVGGDRMRFSCRQQWSSLLCDRHDDSNWSENESSRKIQYACSSMDGLE